VYPTNTAINRENSRFSEIRLKALIILVLLVVTGGPFVGINVGMGPAARYPILARTSRIAGVLEHVRDCARAEDAAGPAASAATDTTVHPVNTAINRENSRFSEIRPKALVIFVLLV